MERRTFLALGAAAVGLAGCTSGPADPDGTPTPTPPDVQRDPDAALRDEVAASEIALIGAYRSALQEHPELAEDLAPFLAHHEAHLARVSPGSTAGAGTTVAPASPGGSGSPDGLSSAASPESTPPISSGTPSGPASGPPAASDVPPGSSAPAVDAQPSPAVGQTLAALATAESQARAQRVAACDGAVDPGLARDLCLVAASEAQHAALLGGLVDEEASS